MWAAGSCGLIRDAVAVGTVPAKGPLPSGLEEDRADRLKQRCTLNLPATLLNELPVQDCHRPIANSRPESFLRVYFMNLAAVRIQSSGLNVLAPENLMNALLEFETHITNSYRVDRAAGVTQW